MRNNRASKAQAVALIRRAVREGFTRTVSKIAEQGKKPFCVSVELSAKAGHPATALSVQIFVTFYFRRQASVSITTNHWLACCNRFKDSGLWAAGYYIGRLAEDRDDYARRQEQGPPMLKEVVL